MNGSRAAPARGAPHARSSAADDAAPDRIKLLAARAWLTLGRGRHGEGASNQRITVLRPVVIGRA